MAAALARDADIRLYVASAGVVRGEPDPFIREVLREVGLDLADHVPHTLDDLGDTNFDLVVPLSAEARERVAQWTATEAVEVEYWPTDDPTEEEGSRSRRLDAYRMVRDGLRRRIEARLRRSEPVHKDAAIT